MYTKSVMKNKYSISNLVSYKNKDSLKRNLAVDLMNSGCGSNGNLIHLAGPLSYHSLAFLK